MIKKTDHGGTGVTTVLPAPSCEGTEINKEEEEEMKIKTEDKKGFLEEEMMISKEEEVEEAICPTIVPCE